MEKQILLITGGSGLVGNGIKMIENDYLNRYEIIYLSSKDCELTNYESTYNYFNQIKPHFIIHLAANVGGLFKNMKYKVDMLEQNILININVLKVAHDIKVIKLIACLSTCIFPDKITYPINETMLHNGPPHYSNDSYAYAKRLLEIHCKAYREQYGDNFICVIPTNIYGPNDNFNLYNSHVIPGLIHKCYLAKQNNKPFEIMGTGNPQRQFIYSKDLAKLIMWILENYSGSDSLILSTNESDEISIKNIVELISTKLNYLNVKYDNNSNNDGQYKKTVSNKKLMNLIGNFNFTSISDGLNETIEWFEKNYNNCRK